MSDDLVKQARKVLEDVTPGPWFSEVDGFGGSRVGAFGFDTYDGTEILAQIRSSERVEHSRAKLNARFIGTARDLVPAMADRIEALTAERDENFQKYVDANEARIAAEAKLAQAIKVKPLVWKHVTSTGDRNVHEAISLLGRYVAWPDGSWKIWGKNHGGYAPNDKSLAGAKAAAQAHYEQRILEELEYVPVETKLTAECDAAEAKLAQAVEVLAFYAKEENYVGEYLADACGCCGTWYEPKIHADGEDSGNKARAFLTTIQPEGKTDDKA